MKRLPTLLLSCMLTLSCMPHELTVMTYNVGVFSKYKENSLPEVASLVKGQGCDLVALNELDSCNRRHPIFQLQQFSQTLGQEWEYAFASAFPFAGGGYGNGVVSAQPILHSFCLPLDKADGAEPRSVAIVETRHCVFASVHLDHKGEQAQLVQVRQINEWFLEHYKGCRKPVLLCGDMNSEADSPTIKALESVWKRLSPESFTYSTENPHECIDYVFSLKTAARVKVVKANVPQEETRFLSDHFPIILTLHY